MSTLPKEIQTSISQYKDLTARFLRWLACRAEDLNITSLDDLNEANSDEPPLPARSVRGQKSSRGDKARGRGRGRGGGAGAFRARTTLPTTSTISQLVSLAEKIVSMTNSAVPDAVFKVLDPIIKLRTEVSNFYQALPSPPPEQLQSNLTHRFFITSLEKIRKLLESCPISRADNALVKLNQYMSVLGLNDSASDDDTEESETEQWLPDYAKKKKAKNATSSTYHRRPLEDFKLVADGDNERDTAQLVAWMLFHDVSRVREHIRGLWGEYRAGTISLVTVSFLTTQSGEVVREMVEDFRQSFGYLYSNNGNFLDVLKSMFHLDPRLPIRDTMEQLLQMDYSTVDFLMTQVFHCLWQFSLTLKPGHAPVPKAGFFPPFHPAADRSALSSEELLQEDISMLATYLPEVTLHALLSGTEVGIPHHVGHSSVDETALLRNTRSYISDPTHPIPFHLIFEWTVWKDILLTNGTDLQRPLNELLSVARTLTRNISSWYSTYDSRFYTDNLIGDVVRQVVVNKRQIEQQVLHDPILEWKATQTPPIPQDAAHLMWYANPWACGSAVYKLLCTVHHLNVQIVNATGYLGSLMHLYHTLRLQGKMDSWPTMDHLIHLTKSCTFDGKLPKQGESIVAYQKWKGAPPYQRPSNAGMGVLPLDYGGSLLGRLAERYEFRLSPEILRELFPGSSDGKVGFSTASNSFSQHGLRFGGKLCDPFTLLAALRVRIEEELLESPLILNLLKLQTMSIFLLHKWHVSSNQDYEAIHGPNWIQRISQVWDITGWLTLTEAFEKMRKLKGSTISQERVERMTGEAVKAFKEAQHEFELHGSSDNGPTFLYIRDTNSWS